MNNINFNYSFKNIRKIAFNVAFGYSMGKFAACTVQVAISGIILGVSKATTPKDEEKDA